MVTEAAGARPAPPEEILPLTDPAGVIAADILEVRERGTIRIFAGNGVLYEDTRITSALQYAKDVREATICVITGPLLRLNREGKNALLDLHRSGVVDTLHHGLDNDTDHFFNLIETDSGVYFTASSTFHYPKQDVWCRMLIPENEPNHYLAENKKQAFDTRQLDIDDNRNHRRWGKGYEGLPILVA